MMKSNSITNDDVEMEILQILEDQRFYLCKYLEPENYYAYLRSKHVMTGEDEEEIKSLRTRRQRAERFLDILILKGPACFKALVDAILRNGTQPHLAAKLNKEYERRRINLHIDLRLKSVRVDLDIDVNMLPKPVTSSEEKKISC
ncbi:B-cell lymphoma/leukemia 10-like isoform X2 [Saccostrea echinata]|uniref:B-cell lymphoma/leukemia 10-like isoform X2 n=1 Tax=Saccostrea echinata TaxID=191078 RepID=UPI002A83313C|nr:B-cell lymphoma/leukemia 10-like isoform X2 [Saccostrea echinata]